MNEQQPFRPKARLPRGFRDRDELELAAERRMLDAIRRIYESYGFQALETSTLEYADALGKFLPDQDRPNEGVFSFTDDDGQWLALRYDLTAPLARYVAENFQTLPKPFRRYQVGTVWRNEKPGPGRYREFTQFDADTVGSASPAADAELLMMMADTLEALGLKRREYVIKFSSRKLLDAVMDAAEVAAAKRSTVLRAIDKLDRLGIDGVRALLGAGRKDESGDFTKGAELSEDAVNLVLQFLTVHARDEDFYTAVRTLLGEELWKRGADDLVLIANLCEASGYMSDRVQLDPSVVRGLDYYTGAVYEAQLTFQVANESGETVVFGSIGGGGRYDDLVARFTGQTVPAAGFSIGVSRLLSALKARTGAEVWESKPLVVVLTIDRDRIARSFKLAAELRAAGLRAEAYLGTRKFGDQLKYADHRGAAVAIIEGSDERARGEVTVKDLRLGAELAKSIADRAAWVRDRPAQRAVKRADMVAEIRAILARKG